MFTSTTCRDWRLVHAYTAPTPIASELETEDDGSNTNNDNTLADAPTETTAPANEEKKGCCGAIGVGAIAVLAVAGLACGIVSKKRED